MRFYPWKHLDLQVCRSVQEAQSTIKGRKHVDFLHCEVPAAADSVDATRLCACHEAIQN